MTPENQSLVRDSFAKVVPIAPQAAAMLYDLDRTRSLRGRREEGRQ